MPRIVMLGCGTGVGKTHVSRALLVALGRHGSTIGLKPIETGFGEQHAALPPPGSDAATLIAVSSLRTSLPHPLYQFAAPISPHLAARREGVEIQLERVSDWLEAIHSELTPRISSPMAHFAVVETAGGVFSPVSACATNFDLARAMEPAIWVLVAADALGVLHGVTATLEAMRARGRSPDHVVLSAAVEPDSSTSANAAELASLGIVTPSAVLARGDDRGIDLLVQRILQPAA